ncbi:hypothetical protein EOD40_16920 [Flavobacterium sufflavum]|uniref:Dihydrolipoamide dehydrogenase n=1 Tax=Flavobacterium sufflavum TaxID=1921138 RepID=A0A437KKB0_9FLAO|nr:hypothetical protein [Flavobacterium sufflavum]RVT71323.1 hypothetical protein EOD40_16920 [Flavobacterium sufflavum]
MKKIITLFAFVSFLAISSCTTEDNFQEDNDTIPEAFEIKNVNLAKVANNEYNFKSTFQYEIGGNLYDDETVLIYRLTTLINSTTPVWQLIPRTIYFDNGQELDYDYDFSKVDFIITARGTYNLLDTPGYINNQTFRVVIVPSVLAASMDTSNYNEVMNTLKISESQVQKVKL